MRTKLARPPVRPGTGQPRPDSSRPTQASAAQPVTCHRGLAVGSGAVGLYCGPDAIAKRCHTANAPLSVRALWRLESAPLVLFGAAPQPPPPEEGQLASAADRPWGGHPGEDSLESAVEAMLEAAADSGYALAANDSFERDSVGRPTPGTELADAEVAAARLLVGTTPQLREALSAHRARRPEHSRIVIDEQARAVFLAGLQLARDRGAAYGRQLPAYLVQGIFDGVVAVALPASGGSPEHHEAQLWHRDREAEQRLRSLERRSADLEAILLAREQGRDAPDVGPARRRLARVVRTASKVLIASAAAVLGGLIGDIGTEALGVLAGWAVTGAAGFATLTGLDRVASKISWLSERQASRASDPSLPGPESFSWVGWPEYLLDTIRDARTQQPELRPGLIGLFEQLSAMALAQQRGALGAGLVALADGVRDDAAWPSLGQLWQAVADAIP